MINIIFYRSITDLSISNWYVKVSDLSGMLLVVAREIISCKNGVPYHLTSSFVSCYFLHLI